MQTATATLAESKKQPDKFVATSQAVIASMSQLSEVADTLTAHQIDSEFSTVQYDEDGVKRNLLC